ncbi:MAG: ABC transporter substrate-binding protein [Holosporaceae bacterium]|jgi:putative ABC transport system substrate-binding protein|nr:ABC transporter substrate-binding protein [Holosporaceae bacterium]
MRKRNILAIVTVTGAALAIALCCFCKKKDLPLVAIANYGPHASLEASIRGTKMELEEQGFVENKNIRYEIADVGFDAALIPQMITKLRAADPKVMLVKATPIAQFAKGKIHDIPLVFCDITDPVSAGLVNDASMSHENVTGSSDRGDLGALLNFVKTILPNARTVGLLYSTSESNDAALVSMMKAAAAAAQLSVVAIPVDQSRDIPLRMQQFRGRVDFIYVGTSGPIQPALPTIATEAEKMGIPVFNAEDQAVQDGLALASFGVNYELVGRNAGKLIAQLLKDEDIKNLPPLFLKAEHHKCYINRKLAEKFKIQIPKNVTVVK